MHFFRGEPRVKDDTDVTAADIASRQPRALRRPVEQRDLQTHRRAAADRVDAPTVSIVGEQMFDADHAPVFIFPNPLNPEEVRRHQQRLHVPRPVEQRHAVAQAAGLGRRGHHQAGNNYRYLPLFVESQGFFDEAWKLKGPTSHETVAR